MTNASASSTGRSIAASTSSTTPTPAAAAGRRRSSAVEDALRRLQTDYIDLYQVHRPALRDAGDGVEPAGRGLTGKYRKGEQTPDTLRARHFPKAMADGGSLDKLGQLTPLAQCADMSLTHMALAFVVAHPALTSAIIGPRIMEQLDGLLAGAEVVPDDAPLDRIDEIVPPGVEVAPLEGATYAPPWMTQASLRRRSAAARAAA